METTSKEIPPGTRCELKSPGGRVCGKPADRVVWSLLDPDPKRASRFACKACATVYKHVLTEKDPAIPPGTRCECRAKHGRGYHRYTGKCINPATSLVPVTETHPDDPTDTIHGERWLCAPCAAYHEAKAGAR